jgi:hypothetical protein
MALHVGHVDATLELVAAPTAPASPPEAPTATDLWAFKEILRPLVVEIVDEELERYRRSRA